MKFFKKWGVLFLSLFFIAAITVVVLFSKKSIDELKVAVSERDVQIGTLEASLTDIGPLSKGYVLNRDVRAGELISSEYFTEVSIPEKIILGLITDLDGIDGAFFRTSLDEGTVLTLEDVNYVEVEDSQRYFDIYLDQLPVGIQEGDYIDIRITFPYGEDFIGLSNKKIEQINSSILKVVLNENEIMVYNSMLLDRVLYAGTQIYATQYVDAGSQQGAEAFYPINTSQSELLLQNPNALEISKQEMILKRQAVEEALGGGITDRTEEQIDALNDAIEDLRERTQDRVISANEVIEDRRAAEAEREAEAAGESNSDFMAGESVW